MLRSITNQVHSGKEFKLIIVLAFYYSLEWVLGNQLSEKNASFWGSWARRKGQTPSFWRHSQFRAVRVLIFPPFAITSSSSKWNVWKEKRQFRNSNKKFKLVRNKQHSLIQKWIKEAAIFIFIFLLKNASSIFDHCWYKSWFYIKLFSIFPSKIFVWYLGFFWVKCLDSTLQT